MDDSTVRRYRLRPAEVYKLWTEQKGRPVLKDMAFAIGMSPNGLSNAMRGISNVQPGTADKIASVLGCRVEDIAEASAFTPLTPRTDRRTVAITFAMDTDLMCVLNKAAQETGKNRSLIVREAVRSHLNVA